MTERSKGTLRLRNADSRIVVEVARQYTRPPTWCVRNESANEIGLIASAPRENWRGKLVARSMDIPSRWIGWILINGAHVAYIRDAQVANASSGEVIVELTRRQKGWQSVVMSPAKMSTWTMRLADGIDESMRLMALGWLAAAFDLQRYCDTSD